MLGSIKPNLRLQIKNKLSYPEYRVKQLNVQQVNAGTQHFVYSHGSLNEVNCKTAVFRLTFVANACWEIPNVLAA